MARVLESWAGTPYLPGCSARGRSGGVDCVRFVVGVLDELYGVRTPVERLPPSTSLHNRAAAMRAMRVMVQAWPCEVIDPGEPPMTTDVIILRHGAGPGHVAILSPVPNVVWHSTYPSGVVKAGLGSLGHVEAIFRLAELSRWFR